MTLCSPLRLCTPSSTAQAARTRLRRPTMPKTVNPRDIILAPVVSEKSYVLMAQNVYTFYVATDSNKSQIKDAAEKTFGVKVDSVNTVKREGKPKRTRIGFGVRKSTARAYVTLREGSDSIYICGACA